MIFYIYDIDITVYAEQSVSRIFGESIENCCWRHLIWRKAVAVSKHNSYKPKMALFKFGGIKII